MRIGLDPQTDRAVFQLVKQRGLSREQVRSRPMVVYRDYRLGRFEGPQPLQLTYTGGLVTDAVRYLNDEGDGLGRSAPGQGGMPSGVPAFVGDSSVGVWQACNFNYHNSSGAETDEGLNGFNQGNTTQITITSVSAAAAAINAKFGSRVFKGDVLPGGDGVTCAFAQEATLSGTDPAGKVWTSSVWVFVPPASTLIGKSYDFGVIEVEGGLGNGNVGSTSGTFVQGWQRLVFTYTTVAANIDNLSCSLEWTGTAGEVIYTDGWQLEPNPIATPYVMTWPNNRLARLAGAITAPSVMLDTTQSWLAFRLRPGFDSTASTIESSGAANPHYFSWMTAVNTEIRGQYELSSDTFLLRRGSTTVNVVKSAAQSFLSGSTHTVVCAWEAGLIKISVDGAAFVVDSTAQHIPSGLPTTFTIGTKQDTSDGWFNGDILWVLAGTGVISDTDAAAINAYGNAGPASPPALELGTPADFYWPADTATWWTPSVGAYAESGAGVTGGAGAGADELVINKTGVGVAGTVGAGPSESVFVETGVGVSGLVGTGADVDIDVDTGFGVAGAVGAGADVDIASETGTGVAGSVGAGFDNLVLNKTGTGKVGTFAAGSNESITQETGYGQLRAVAYGADNFVLNKTGTGKAGTFAAGADVDVDADTGLGKAGTFARGYDEWLLNKTGAGKVGTVGAGVEVLFDSDGGFGKAGTFAAGFDNFLLNKKAAATAGGVAAGVDNWILNKTGAATVGGVAAGPSESLTQETGSGVSDANAYGADNFILNKTGSGVAGSVGAGVESVTLPTVLIDTFTRTLSNQWGTADSGQSWTVSTAAAFSTDGAEGIITPQAANTIYRGRTSLGLADYEVFSRFRLTALPSGANSTPGFETRWNNAAGTGYLVALSYTTSGNLNVLLQKRTPSVSTIVGSTTVATGLGGGEWFRIRIQNIGSTFQVKVWRDGTSEPTAWTSSGTDSTYTVGDFAVGNFQATGGSNLPAFQVDEINVNVKVESGYATVGGVGAGQENHAVNKAGYATAGLVGAGADADAFAETGAGIAGTVGAGVAALTDVDSGFAVAGTVGVGSSVSIDQDTGYATVGLVGAGADEDIFQETGTGIVGTFASGTAETVAQNIYAKAGYGVCGLVGAGARARELSRSNYADVAAVGYGSDIDVASGTGYGLLKAVGGGADVDIFSETGYADVAGVASGADAFTDSNTGYADADADGSGRSASIFVESGAGVCGAVAAGSSVYTLNRSGYGQVGADGSGRYSTQAVTVESGYADLAAVGSGADADILNRSGHADTDADAAGSRAVTHIRSGYATVGSVASGTSFRFAQWIKAGYATVRAVAFGQSASITQKSGFADVNTDAFGTITSTRAAVAKSGYAVAQASGSGEKALERNKRGHAIANLTAEGHRNVVLTKNGYAILEGTGSGVRNVSLERAGYADIGTIAAGFEEFHKFRYPSTPPGDIVGTLIGRIMENADGGLREPGDGALTGSSRGHLAGVGQGRIKETV